MNDLEDKVREKFIEKNIPYTKQFPYISIYGSKCYSDFSFIVKNELFRVECKSQKVSGSADEKLAYLYLNAINAFKENNILIILEGNGFRQSSIQWLKDSCNKIPERNVFVLHFEELEEFLNGL